MAVILVTGGAGFVGAHVCKALAAAGHTPVTYDNLCRGERARVLWGPLEEGDINDAAKLTAMFARHKPEAVMHLAGLAYVHESVTNPAAYFTANAEGSQNVIAAMKVAGVKRLVASSSCAVYAPSANPTAEDAALGPTVPYGESKLRMEQAMAAGERDFGLQWTALRYFNAAGADPEARIGESATAGIRIIPNLLDVALGKRAGIKIFGTDYATPDGTCIRDFVHVDDIATAHVLALVLRPDAARIFNLGNGRGSSMRAVINAVAAVTGKPIPVETGPRRAGDAPVMVADATRARDHLGWRPRWPELRDMVAHAWAWHKSQSELPRRSGGARA